MAPQPDPKSGTGTTLEVTTGAAIFRLRCPFPAVRSDGTGADTTTFAIPLSVGTVSSIGEGVETKLGARVGATAFGVNDLAKLAGMGLLGAERMAFPTPFGAEPVVTPGIELTETGAAISGAWTYPPTCLWDPFFATGRLVAETLNRAVG